MSLVDADGKRLPDADILELLYRWDARNQFPLMNEVGGPEEIGGCLRNASKSAKPREAKPPGLPVEDVSWPARDSESTGESKYTISFRDIATAWKSEFHRKEPPLVYACGFPLRITPGELTVIGGGPGAGKSTFCHQILVEILERNRDLRATICNVEVPGDAIWGRIIAGLAGVNYGRMLNRINLTPTEESAITLANDRISTLLDDRLTMVRPPFHLIQIHNAILERQPNIVLLDYLQRIPPSPQCRLDHRIQLMAFMDEARQIASQGIAVIAVSSLSRPAKKGTGYKEADITSYSGSAEIEYAADEAFTMSKADVASTIVDVKCHKARNRIAPAWQMCHGDTMRFRQVMQNFRGETIYVENTSEGAQEWQY